MSSSSSRRSRRSRSRSRNSSMRMIYGSSSGKRRGEYYVIQENSKDSIKKYNSSSSSINIAVLYIRIYKYK
jgi:hypothetical protein